MEKRKIKNFDELAQTDARRAALEIAEAGLAAIDTDGVIRRTVFFDGTWITIGAERFDIREIGRIIVSGVGKCAVEAVHTLEDILGDRISAGVVLYPTGEATFKHVQAFRGSHPLPTEENVRGARAMVDSLADLSDRDLVLFVVSGGGSTLLCLPEDEQCKNEAKIIQALMRTGATIQEMNTVRKHLSLARGGHLAKYAYPARVVSLILSDVPGNDIQFVASGPTVRDNTNVSDAVAILTAYDIFKKCEIDEKGLVETPKEEKYFARVKNLLVVSNSLALRAMETKAHELGLSAVIRDEMIFGEAAIVGSKIVRALHDAPAKTVHLYGGETTVTVHGHGQGGRNLELILAIFGAIKPDELVMTIASDGHDHGPFAGAICDTMTVKAAQMVHADVEGTLSENNEYPLFEKIGNYLLTGDTGSNVSDLIIALKL
jgi:glycerate 2-kinase